MFPFEQLAGLERIGAQLVDAAARLGLGRRPKVELLAQLRFALRHERQDLVVEKLEVALGLAHFLLRRLEAGEAFVLPDVHERVNFADLDLERACELRVEVRRLVNAFVVGSDPLLVRLDMLGRDVVSYATAVLSVYGHQHAQRAKRAHAGTRGRISGVAR